METKDEVLLTASHKDWCIALYYLYIDLRNVKDHVEFQKNLCETYNLKGRIRVSSEGINGVLSGLRSKLELYEETVKQELKSSSSSTFIDLDVKYCLLREELPIQAQLFDKLLCKETKTVISLFDQDETIQSLSKSNGRSRQSNRRRRRKEQRKQQKLETTSSIDISNLQKEMMKLEPAVHLSAEEWNEKIKASKEKEALLLDVRNVYESRVGHFATSNVPTLLTNTRKYSDLPHLLATNPDMQDKKVFMYCTGGVRCERVSMLVQNLYPQTKVYQLKGGIQTYLKETKDEESCLFQGKNFVFDPRRTDPVHFGATVGKCLACDNLHDDYDNGYAPSESKEARCNTCRMLVLICNDCRPKYVCWGEECSKKEQRPLYCGLDTCVHEGAAPEAELLQSI